MCSADFFGGIAKLVGGSKYFLIHPYLGKIPNFD